MASAQELLTGLKQYYPYIEETPGLTAELSRRSGQGANLGNILSDAPGYSEVASGARNNASGIYGPTYQAGQTQLDLQDQSAQGDITDTNRTYDNLLRTLREGAANSTTDLTERFNNLGLLQSGLTAAGLGKIQTDLGTNTGNSESDRASKLAQLALQRAGINVQKSANTANYTQNINDYVTKLLGGSQTSVNDVLKPKLTTIDLGNRVALVDERGNIHSYLAKGKLPGSGSSSGGDTGLAALLGALTGTTGAAQASGGSTAPSTAPDATKAILADVKSYFANHGTNNGITESELLPALYQSYVGDFGGNGALSKEQVDKLVYDSRKPFESQNYVSNLPSASSPSFGSIFKSTVGSDARSILSLIKPLKK